MAKDAIFALVAGVVVLILALIFGGAPLGHPRIHRASKPNPGLFWFLIWYYAFLALIPPDIEDILIIGFPAVIMTWMIVSAVLCGQRGARAVEAGRGLWPRYCRSNDVPCHGPRGLRLSLGAALHGHPAGH